MDLSKALKIQEIDEIKIVSNVRLINRQDLNPIISTLNLQVQFNLSGDLKGSITSYLCLDGHELTSSEKNYIYPLFVESMNILIGQQILNDPQLSSFKIILSPPKMSLTSKEIHTALKSSIQYYQLELDGLNFVILTEYGLEALN